MSQHTHMWCAQDCPKGSWCAGGVHTGPNTPVRNICGMGLTTLGRRATSMRQCVNEAGRKYSVDASGNPSSTVCEADTYRSVPTCQAAAAPPQALIGWVADAARCSLPALNVCCRSPGLKKQRACVGCPNGFTTRNTTGNIAFSACGELTTAGCCCLAWRQPEQHTSRHRA